MKKILVVEDSATMRLLIRMHLKNFGDVMLTEARDGVEALRGEVEPAQHPCLEPDDLVGQPIRGAQLFERRVDRQHRIDVTRGLAEHEADGGRWQPL